MNYQVYLKSMKHLLSPLVPSPFFLILITPCAVFFLQADKIDLFICYPLSYEKKGISRYHCSFFPSCLKVYTTWVTRHIQKRQVKEWKKKHQVVACHLRSCLKMLRWHLVKQSSVVTAEWEETLWFNLGSLVLNMASTLLLFYKH